MNMNKPAYAKASAGKPVIFVFSTAYHPFVGGAEVAIEQVTKRLKDRFDFVIFTSRMRRDLPKSEVRDEVLVVRVGFGNKFDKFLLPVFGLFKAANFGRPALFWGMDLSFGSLAAAILKIFYPCLAGRQAQVPFVFTIQYGYGDKRVAFGRLGVIGFAFRFILMQADYVTAISSYLLKLCGKYGYIGREQIVHNGVDVKKFSAARLKKHSKPTNTIITVSRLVPKNGVDILIKAIAEIKKEISDIKLHIVGDGPERKNLEHMAYGLGLMANIQFFGEIPYDKLPKYLSEADVFARPSRSEGMGNAFVEALAAGIPIVGTPVGGILDIIEDGETGLFAKVDDPKDLAEKIKLLLEDENLAQQIVENGQKMVEERFSWDKIAQSYAEVFSHELSVKKRILIATGVFPPEVGGPATYSKILLDELPKENFGVRVLSFGLVRRLPKILRHIAYGLKLMSYGRNADIIFAQDPVSVGLPAVIASKILRKRFLLKIVGDYAWEQGVQRFGVKEVLNDFLNNKYRWEVEFLRKIQKFVVNRAEKIIVPSEYLKKVVSAWGINPNKIHVIYNALDAPSLAITKLEARRKLKLRQDDKIIVSAGRPVPWKGFDALRELMPEVVREFPEAKLFILSHESKEKLLLYLASADVFVLNTAYEGFSHQILEAMAIGTPVITTKVGGNLELVEDGVSGILVSYNSKEEIKNAILKVLKDNALSFKISQNAPKKAKEFSKERMIVETTKMIKNL